MNYFLINVLKTITMKKNLLLFLMISIFSVSFAQQKITVTGKVTDESGELLPGVNIIIDGTYTGTISGLDGSYSLTVPGMDAVLIYSFIGYTQQRIEVKEQRIIEVVLGAETTDLGEVIVTAQLKGQIGARQEQINSNNIKNVVASDRLQENPDANAAEAIGRLPGVSLLRSGGEGAGLVIRGLEPKYSNVTINGEQMASSNGTNRSTGVSGISQYALQGVEVYKSLTADMEANAPAGTVNLVLREAPKGFKSDLMAQVGYNDLNQYFGNYKFVASASNRFNDDKFGVILTVNTEKVNRSAQTMSAQYGLFGETTDLKANGLGLNIHERFIYRSSVNLALDYRLHPSTTIKLFNQFNYSNTVFQAQAKNYGFGGTGSLNYNMADAPENKSKTLHSALSGITNLDFLNIEMDYGLTYAMSKNINPGARSWGFGFSGISENIPLETLVESSATDLLPLFDKYGDNAEKIALTGFGRSESEMEDKNLSAFLNVKVPISIGENIEGYLKFGGKYRKKNRFMDNTHGTQGMHPFLAHYWYDEHDYLQPLNGDYRLPYTLAGFEESKMNNFLSGRYDYGTLFNIDKLNDVTQWWEDFSAHVLSLPEAERTELIGSNIINIDYSSDMQGSVINDQDLIEDYFAGYIMGEFNFGKWLMFMPGLRFESTSAVTKGFLTVQPLYSPPMGWDLPGKDTSHTRTDNFLLPMIHMRIKPTDFMYLHMAYTQTISRPDFNSISPNYYVNPSGTPVFNGQNPELKSEMWTNYDAQLTFHGKKLGLLSISGFYKTVEDKIWGRTYTRIKGDPLVPYFGENDAVQVTVRENHAYDIKLYGVEIDLQTSFWYLPKPLNFFTIYANYTYTHSQTHYPTTRLESVMVPGERRPIKVRVDSTYTAPMRNQPQHIANASLGFNHKNLNTWFSFQYNGGITKYTHPAYTELDIIKEHFYRFDFQATYDFYVNKGKSKLQLLANFANLSNFVEKEKRREDPRFTYMEAYGWTVDLGLRYRF